MEDNKNIIKIGDKKFIECWFEIDNKNNYYLMCNLHINNDDYYMLNGNVYRQTNNKTLSTITCKRIIGTSNVEEYQKISKISDADISRFKNLDLKHNIYVEVTSYYYDELTGKTIHYFGYEFDDAVSDGHIVPVLSIKPTTDINNQLFISIKGDKEYTQLELDEKCKKAFKDGAEKFYEISRNRKSFTFDGETLAQNWVSENNPKQKQK